MKIFNKLTALVLVGLFAIVSCDPGDFGDTNVNPNASEVAVTSALLTNAMVGIGGWSASTSPALYVQYMSETQYPGTSLYQALTSNPAGNYSGALMDLQNVINFNTDEGSRGFASQSGSNNNQIAVAKIVQSYIFLNVSDMYGDLPYSEALTGETKVAYDTQENIYKGVIETLKTANQTFDSGRPSDGDILFGGDIDMWKKFSNTLRMFAALKLKDRLPSLAQSEFADAVSDGIMVTESAVINYPGGAFKNPWFSLYNGRQDFGISDVMVDKLNSLSDPRLSAYGQAGASGVKGVPYGYTRNQLLAWTDVNPDWSKVLAPQFRQENSSIHLFTPAEVYFAHAEAANSGWIGGNAADYYKAGIQASWNQWGVTGDIDSYVAANPYNASNLADQRWIAIYPNGLRAWSEWRRTDMPALTPTSNAVSAAGTIPTRYIYADSEYNINKENVEAAAARITGGDKQEGHVWWDVN